MSTRAERRKVGPLSCDVGIINHTARVSALLSACASELYITVISWVPANSKDPKAIRAIVAGFIVLHCVSALLEILAVTPD